MEFSAELALVCADLSLMAITAVKHFYRHQCANNSRVAVEYVHRLVLEGEYLPKDPIFTPVLQVAPARQPSRIMLYLDERGSVISSIPLREDQIALTLNDFVELAKRNGMMVLTKQELAAKVTHLLA